MSEKTPDEIAAALADFFDPSEVKFKPAVVNGNRAMALHYIDARVVMDRLDDVLGPMNWQDAYEFLPDGSCLCKLTLRIGGEWITKMDVGGESEQKDGGDRHKAAVSDALKRTAVKFGIGRYLYRLKQTWCDYDPQKKQFVKPPQLPDWAIPRGKATAPAQPPAPTKAGKPPTTKGPRNGKEFKEWLVGYDRAQAAKGRWKSGDLLEHVYAHVTSNGGPEDMEEWGEVTLRIAKEEVKVFDANHPEKQAG